MKRYLILLFVAGCVIEPCVKPADLPPGPPEFTCDFPEGAATGWREQVGTLHSAAQPFPGIGGLDEASGIAASRKNHDIFWSHMDSSNRDNLLYAIAKDGSYQGVWKLWQIGDPIDPEDISMGPAPTADTSDGDYIYYGEVGNNNGIWGGSGARNLKIWVVPEPTTPGDALRTIPSDQIITLEFGFPDMMNGQRQDVEAFMVDPLSGDIFIVTKRTAKKYVFVSRFPQAPGEVRELALVKDLGPISEPTASDISSDGRLIIIKGFNEARIWKRAKDTSITGETFDPGPCMITGISEPQGEAVTFDIDGSGNFYTLSERANGPADIPLYLYEREGVGK